MGADVCNAGKVDAREMLSHGRAPYIPSATSGLSFRRELLERILPMPEVIRITSDNYIKFAAFSIAEGWLSSETVSMQRIHSDNAYTSYKTSKRRLDGRLDVLTGICLDQRFPALRLFGLKAVCRGVTLLLATGGIELELRQQISSYLRSVGPLTWSGAFVRAAGMSALGKLRRSRLRTTGSEGMNHSRPGRLAGSLAPARKSGPFPNCPRRRVIRYGLASSTALHTSNHWSNSHDGCSLA